MLDVIQSVRDRLAARGVRDRNVIVLGCHRSGTSSLTGSLQQAGLTLGDVHTYNTANKRGNREHKEIQVLNDAVLTANGGTWHEPPESVVWSPEHKARRDEIVASFRDVGRWGFKDPRSLFVLDGWREVMEPLAFVGAVRHPFEVMDSLRRRDGFAPEKGFDVWRRYNLRLKQVLDAEGGFPVIDFSVDGAAYRAALKRLCRRLGLTGNLADLDFFTEDLRVRPPVDESAVPRALLDLYAEIRRHAV